MRLAVLTVLLAAPPALAAIRYVDASAPAGGGGQSWATAFRGPHQALAAAQPGDEIRIAHGVYTPAPPSGDRNATFTLKIDLTIRGGFAGLGAPDPDMQEPALFPTILSGDLNGDDGPNFANRADNSRHIATLDLGAISLTFLGDLTIDGVTFRGGYADGSIISQARGGGLHAIGPMGSGGIIASTLHVTRCRFESCHADHGGGVSTTTILPTFDRCVFEGNRAVEGGGIDHEFQAFFHDTPTAVYRRCDFFNNTGATGAGLSHGGEDGRIDSCRFKGNSALFGAAGYSPSANVVTAVNCVFEANDASDGGSAWFDDGAREYLVVNCTFVGNLATGFFPGSTQGSIIHSQGSVMTIRNTIVWGNAAPAPQVFGSAISIFEFCDIQGAAPAPGAGNISADPRFVNAAAGDYRLAPFSPCADAGDTAALPAGITTDAAGRPRLVDDPLGTNSGLPPIGAAVDIGAFERQVCPGDATGDLAVTFADLNIVLSQFGQSGPIGALAGDLTGDGAVTFLDLNLLLSSFGNAC